MIFPEGTVTNGKYLIQFKKGAFMSLNPVQPMTVDCHAAVITLSSFTALLYAMFKSPYNVLHYELYPVFEPNEYFWKHHWEPNQEKESKATTYTRVIR